MAWSKDYGKEAKVAANRADEQADRAEIASDYIDTKQPLIDEFTDEQTNLQTQLNDLVLQSGTDIAEVVQARGGEVTLHERLNKTTAQLADITKQVANHQIVDLFAMCGQSNMQGQSEAAINYQVGAGIAYEYKLTTDSLSVVKHPFGEDISDLILGASAGRGSLPPKFAEAYCNSTGIAPLMVGVAKGATTVEQWMKNGSRADRYAKLVEKVNSAVALSPEHNISVRGKYLVWLQGESDGTNVTAKNIYKERFLQLWSDLKVDCGFTKCFIIRVAKFYTHPVIPIIQAQEELARDNEDIIIATRITGTFTEGNGYLQSNYHYTNAGYNLAGSTAGYKVGDYVKTGIRPILEQEPYGILNKKLEWNYRLGVVQEKNNYLTVTPQASPTLNAGVVEIDALDGYSLNEEIVLSGDFTISLTALLTGAPTGYTFTTSMSDGRIGSPDLLFYNVSTKLMNITIDTVVHTIDISAIANRAVYNHFVIQRDKGFIKLYFNNTLLGSVAANAGDFTIKTIYFSREAYAVFMGKVKHFMVAREVISPQNCDPTFYATNEQGTI